MKRFQFIILVSITAMSAVFLVHLATTKNESTIFSLSENEMSSKSEEARFLIKMKNGQRDSLYIEQPALEYFVYPRTYNSDVPITLGKWRAARALHETMDRLAMSKKMISNEWTTLGPNNYAGRMRAIAYHPGDPNIVYAGAASGGVWKSFNGGLSWMPMSDFLPSLAVGAIAIDKNNPDRLFIGTGEGGLNIDRVFGDGIFISQDGGNTWEDISDPMNLPYDQVCNAIALHPTSPGILFAAIAYQTSNTGGVRRTTDLGKTWRNVLPGFARDVIIDPFNPNRVFGALGYDNGATANGIYRSDNNGDQFSFTKLVIGLPAADSIGRIRMAVSLSRPNTYIAVIVKALKYTQTTEDLLGIYRTTNGGDTWERTPSSDVAEVKRFMATSQPQGWYNLHVGIHPTKPDVVFIGGIDTWRSTNFGTTFSRISVSNSATTPVHVDQHTIAFDPVNPDRMLIGNDGGIYRTLNNTAASVIWEEGNNNLVTFQFYAMDYDKLVPTRVYGGTQDNGTNQGTVGNKAWRQILGGDGGYVVVDYTNSSIVYAESQFASIRKSVNTAQSFFPIQTGIDYSIPGQFVSPIVMHPTVPTTLFLGTNVIYRTTNAGSNWIAISNSLTDATSAQSQTSNIAISKSDPNVAFATTGNGRCWKSTNVNAQFDQVTWTRLGNGQLPGFSLTRVAIDPTNSNNVYVATSTFDSTRNGIYKSTDGGQNWRRAVPPGTDGRRIWNYGPCNAIAIDRNNPSKIFIGTDVGVFVTTDKGDTWQPFGRRLPVVVIDDLRLTEGDVLYAATHGRGMWMASSILSVDKNPSTPASYVLEQNYPNPFSAGSSGNSSTKIAFTLPTKTSVALNVYDLRGRLIQTLAQGEYDAGKHSVTFDGQWFASGVYMYELVAGDFREMKKMMVVR